MMEMAERRKNNDEDEITHAGSVKKEGENLKLEELMPDMHGYINGRKRHRS